MNKKIKDNKAEYEQAAYYEDWYLEGYMNHTASCDFCSGQQMCSEGSELHSNWQAFVKKRKAAKKAWDDAKSEFPPAYDRYYVYWRSYIRWDRALKSLEGENLHLIVTLASKNTELEAKKEEKKRLQRLVDNIPIIQSYTLSLMIARRQPDFDFDKWFEANPIPDAISGDVDF